MIKQTQTKMFDFSDADLDFCAGSKNKFPTAFKKMLAQGYNGKVVSSVSVVGDQVTLDYGVNHGYAADRVLSINTPGLVGEFYIDSVTSNTVTLTVPGALTGIAGGFTTKVAPLGWELVYELDNIQIYAMRQLDDTVRYVRFCFQNNAAHRNAIAVCVGKTFDAETGFINDPLALQSTAAVATPNIANLPRWDGDVAGSTYNNYTYAQGLSLFGKAMVVGSLYHIALLMCSGETYPLNVYGIFAAHCHEYEALDYPVLLAKNNRSGTSSSSGVSYGNLSGSSGYGHASVGNILVRFYGSSVATQTPGPQFTPASNASVLSSNIDNFDTTTAKPLDVFEAATGQYLGGCYGVYECMFSGDSKTPAISKTTLPLVMTDIDFNNQIIIYNARDSSKSSTTFLGFPIEEIKVGY